MATMNVSLPDAMKTWVEEQVATGRYANASDVIRDLVRKEQARAEAQAEFDQLVADAINSPRISMTRQELLARMRRKAAEAVGKKSA